MALNASRNGRFEEFALPAARQKNLGIIAMKVTGQEYLLGSGSGKSDVSSLLRYSMSLPVTTAVVGMPRLEMLEHNIEVARSFSPLPEQEMEHLRQQLTPARGGMEKRLVGHLDGPTANPDVLKTTRVGSHRPRIAPTEGGVPASRSSVAGTASNRDE
jgi:hypothetical protein